MGDTVSARWWRRNAAALVAVAVLLPTTAAVIGAGEWWGANQGRPSIPTTIEARETGDFAGATWGPVRIGTPSADALADAPEGTRVIVVEVPVDPHGTTVSCGIPLLRETGGAQRRWNDALTDLDAGSRNPSQCPSDATAPFTIEVPYLVPSDAVGPFGLELTLGDQLPRYLLLRLP